MKRVRLTSDELDAIISIAGDVDVNATVESCYEPDEQAVALRAWETGMEKLRVMLGNRSGRPA